jgi:hypothetical protein
MNLGDNFVTEGLVNRITPFTTNIGGQPVPGAKNYDTKRTYDNLMKRFKFGGLDKPGIYLDETVMRMCYTHRRLFGELALHLIQEEQKDKAAEVLAYADKMIPDYNVPKNYTSGGVTFAKAYALCGNKKMAEKNVDAVWNNCKQYLQWYLSLDANRFSQSTQDCMIQFYVMQQCLEVAEIIDTKKADKMTEEMSKLADTYENRGGKLYQDQ